MFDDVIKKLRRLEGGISIQIEMPVDDDGYFDRLCPGIECGAHFKVLFSDWRDKVQDAVVYCPICREEADSTEWNTMEQGEYIREVGLRHVQREIGSALSSDARRFNRSQSRGGFIQMSMSYRPGSLPIPVPAAASEIMEQRSSCEECSCNYSSIGAAFFCPACGHNSAGSTFSGAVETTRRTLDSIPMLLSTLTESIGRDHAEDSIRQICENAVCKLVGAFQRYAEAKFTQLPNANEHRVRRNVFQNLMEGSALWSAATGVAYEQVLSPGELSDLQRFFQQRHVLSHQDGIVDRDYRERSGDTHYSVGQRLVVRDQSVAQLAVLVEKLAQGLDNASRTARHDRPGR